MLARGGRRRCRRSIAALLVEHFTGTDARARARPRRACGRSRRADRRRRSTAGRRSGAPAGEPVHRIIGCREFYGLRARCSRPKRWSRGPTPKRWSTRCCRFVRETAAQDGRLPHPRSRHRNGRHRAGAACAGAAGDGGRRRHIRRCAGHGARAMPSERGLAGALRRRCSPTGLRKFRAVRCNRLQSALYTDRRASQTLQREVRDFDPLARARWRRGWARRLPDHRRAGARASRRTAAASRSRSATTRRHDVARCSRQPASAVCRARRDLGGHDRVLVFERAMTRFPRRSEKPLGKHGECG